MQEKGGDETDDKKLLTICPACGKLAFWNGESNIACDQCGFAFIVEDEIDMHEYWKEKAKTADNPIDGWTAFFKSVGWTGYKEWEGFSDDE